MRVLFGSGSAIPVPRVASRRTRKRRSLGTVLILIVASVLGVSSTVQCASSNPDPAPATNVASARTPLPAYSPRFGRAKPIVAVVAENTFTELTDYVIPYGVLSESGVADVFALATTVGPIRMFPALRIEPQAGVAEFDDRFPLGADYVVVPAVHSAEDPVLLDWVKAQAAKGATIVGVCDGVWVLANAGLLENRKAVGHWYSFDRLDDEFRYTEWIRNRRYVADGNVVTTTGVTASIPVSVAIVEAIAGRRRAAEIAEAMGIRRWTAEHRSDRFELGAGDILTAAVNWVSFWSHEDVGILIGDGVDEVGLALVADSLSRTYRSSAVSVSASRKAVTSRHGLVILPDRAAGVDAEPDRFVELDAEAPPVTALDASLREIEESYGSATADWVALQLEYPRD